MLVRDEKLPTKLIEKIGVQKVIANVSGIVYQIAIFASQIPSHFANLAVLYHLKAVFYFANYADFLVRFDFLNDLRRLKRVKHKNTI